MRETHIGRVDLNLLPALVALLDERHVSRAAVRVGLSQPAMSRSLQRLRRQFDDELLVRGPNGYSLTPRAEQIRERLAGAVARLEQVFDVGDSFDPANAASSFRVAMSDYTFPLFGPTLARMILAESSKSSIKCEPLDARVFDQLDAGSTDLLLYGRAAPEKYCSRKLFTDRFVCVVAADHPAAATGALSLVQYVQWPHLAIDIGHAGIERSLHAHGLSRRTVVSMPYHALAASALPGTELILTIAGRLVSHFVDSTNTRILKAPNELGTLQFASVWHPRLSNDPSHTWLRQIVHDVANATPPL